MSIQGLIQQCLGERYAVPSPEHVDPTGYSLRISQLANNLLQIAPKEFQQFSLNAKKRILTLAAVLKPVNIIPYVTPATPYFTTADIQKEAFNLSSEWRRQIIRSLCEKKNKELKIIRNSLEAPQVSRLLEEVPEELKQTVESLDLHKCFTVGTLKPLEKYPLLKALKVPSNSCYTELAGLEAIGSRLEKLDLSESGINNLDFLTLCPNLTFVNAEGCCMLIDVTGPEKIPSLKTLILPEVSSVSKIKMTRLQLACPQLDIQLK